MKKIEFYTEKTAVACNIIAAAAVAAMMLVIVLDVTMRYLRVAMPGAYDIVGLLGALAVACALTYTSVQRGHIAVDFVYRKVPERCRPFFDIFNELAGCVFFALLAWQCFAYASVLRRAGEVSLTIQLPTYPFLACIGLNCVLLSAYLLLHLLRSLRGAFAR